MKLKEEFKDDRRIIDLRPNIISFYTEKQYHRDGGIINVHQKNQGTTNLHILHLRRKEVPAVIKNKFREKSERLGGAGPSPYDGDRNRKSPGYQTPGESSGHSISGNGYPTYKLKEGFDGANLVGG